MANSWTEAVQRYSLVLASASPRRMELLTNLGLEFKVIPSGIQENMDQSLPPEKLVLNLAQAKARHVVAGLSDLDGPTIVIAGDTIVFIDGKAMGQPSSAQEAKQMLGYLSGRCHKVYTGLAVISLPAGKMFSDYEVSSVYIRSLNSREIETYVGTGESMDKAGAYALQGIGAALVEKVEGCVTNIIGLPVPLLVQMLRSAGVPVLGSI